MSKLIEKEVIRPGTYWYKDEATGQPRKLTVTPELTRYWHEQGNAMLSTGLTVPVPYEHDFNAHPMTPAEKLKSNAGWVKEYRLKGDRLFAALDVQDKEVKSKLPGTIRWTSPWINSFTDGNGKEWKNVISHLALTTRPRIVEQEPFGSVAAALSLATEVGMPLSTDSSGHSHDDKGRFSTGDEAYNRTSKTIDFHRSINKDAAQKLSSTSHKARKAGKSGDHKKAYELHGKVARMHHKIANEAHKRNDHRVASMHREAADAHEDAAANHEMEHHGAGLSIAGLLNTDGQPVYPIAFSLYSGAAFGNFPPPKDKGKKPPTDSGAEDVSVVDDNAGGGGDDLDDDGGADIPDDGDDTNDDNIDLEPLGDPAGDVSMTELLCDLLGALGVVCEHSDDESQFKRNLYNAAMTEIHRLVGEGKNKAAGQDPKNRTNPPGQPPNNPKPGQPGQPNPLIQQEQQPMYMSLEEINKLDEPLKSVALAMHAETVKANARAAEADKVLGSLRDAKLKEASAARAKRVALIGKVSPRAKADLEAMLSLPAMAMSLGEGGEVVDPMAQTLAVLEKGLADLPRLLTTDQTALSVQAQPQDADMLTAEKADEIADGLARQMGCAPLSKAS